MIVIKNTDNYVEKEANMFGDCEETLKLMSEGRIFNIEYHKEDGSFHIYEKCDEYFGEKLTLKMCIDLSELFSKIAEKIE
ncbi:hypothetical protein JOC34_000617 [Virgibacillus halotolerans]|uniref:hypothetical protein n=1 Tax=Virgibacillus halotolerans TaxID=1071053 RepID=UPI0019610E73|nr:hypothetical protein [Virgibacillus halotolerans]MBM7598260.1 hypothetical protein [Virgibacillus halotolerans]